MSVWERSGVDYRVCDVVTVIERETLSMSTGQLHKGLMWFLFTANQIVILGELGAWTSSESLVRRRFCSSVGDTLQAHVDGSEHC